MLLNHEEIKAKSLLSSDNNSHYTNSSYSLSIGKIINSNGKALNEYVIPPQGMVMVISNEKFTLPKDVIGYTTVKNSLSISGILAINIGIVDSEYKGPISSVLINFGKTDFDIKKDDKFMRMTFHEFKAPSINIPLKDENKFINERLYFNERKKDSIILGDKFLYLNKEIEKFKGETIKGVNAYFTKLVAMVALIISAIGVAYSVFIGYSDSDAIKKYQSQNEIITELKKIQLNYQQSNEELLKRISKLEVKANRQKPTTKQHVIKTYELTNF